MGRPRRPRRPEAAAQCSWSRLAADSQCTARGRSSLPLGAAPPHALSRKQPASLLWLCPRKAWRTAPAAA
eukprot:scaffold30847_cov53-Phaeocystis_antarctica.AAC.1